MSTMILIVRKNAVLRARLCELVQSYCSYSHPVCLTQLTVRSNEDITINRNV